MPVSDVGAFRPPRTRRRRGPEAGIWIDAVGEATPVVRGRRLALLRITATIGVLGSAFVLAACGSGGTQEAPDRRVVATTGILGDVVGQVVGDEASLEILIPNGTDPHEYRTSAQQVAAILTADLVFANGLSLEEGLIDVLAEAEAEGVRVIRLGDSLDPLANPVTNAPDPHVWLDPIRMADGVRLVAAELGSQWPDGDWSSRAARYASELEQVHLEIVDTLSPIPLERRKLVTNHDALRYFADRYGFEIVGTVIPGTSGLSDPSSADLSALVATIRSEDVPAIFTESTESSALARELADEFSGGVAVVELHTGSLGEPGSGADTLSGLLLSDAQLIAEALT